MEKPLEGTGIIKSTSDKEQPFRVWFKGKIVWFARTQEEAIRKLNEEYKREGAIRTKLTGTKPPA